MLLHHNTVCLKIQAGTGAMAKKKQRIIIKKKVLNKGQTAAGLCYSLQKQRFPVGIETVWKHFSVILIR